MAVQQAGPRLGDEGKGLLQVGDEFLDQRLAPRTVGGTVGEDVMAGAAIGVEDDPDQVPGIVHPRVRREHRRHVMIAAEPGNDVDGRQLAGHARLGNDHCCAMLDGAMVEGREQRAFKLGKLDPIGLLELLRRHDLVDLQPDGFGLLRPELDVNGRAVGVPLAGADAVRVGVEPDDRLGGVFPRLEGRERARGSRSPSSRCARPDPVSSP